MAQSIDLTGDGDAPKQPLMSTPPPAGQGQVPQPADLPAGVNPTNPDGSLARPPLPVGRAVREIDPATLTDMERDVLTQTGWKEGEPIPVNMAEAIAAVEANARQEADQDRIPVDPNTPPVSINPIDIENLPENEQAKYRAQIQQALTDTAPPPPVMPARPIPAVAQKVAQARQIPSTPAQDQQAPQAAPSPESPQDAVNPLDGSQAPSSGQQDPAADDAVAPFTHCPHCAWDLDVPALPEPEYGEKMRFLQCVMNGQQFTQEYSLMAGSLLLGFRTLTTREMDMVYRQVFVERERGVIQTDADMWERINRFRMFLQLTLMRSTERNRELPDGLTPESNPHATHYWKLPQDAEEPLMAIESYMLNEVMPTETLIRLTQFNCQQFNRLVSKLEALTDNSDFWKKTEEQH